MAETLNPGVINLLTITLLICVSQVNQNKVIVVESLGSSQWERFSFSHPLSRLTRRYY